VSGRNDGDGDKVLGLCYRAWHICQEADSKADAVWTVRRSDDCGTTEWCSCWTVCVNGKNQCYSGVEICYCMYRVTTCLENLEMSRNLTAVRVMAGILLNVREVSGKKSCQRKVA